MTGVEAARIIEWLRPSDVECWSTGYCNRLADIVEDHLTLIPTLVVGLPRGGANVLVVATALGKRCTVVLVDRLDRHSVDCAYCEFPDAVLICARGARFPWKRRLHIEDLTAMCAGAPCEVPEEIGRDEDVAETSEGTKELAGTDERLVTAGGSAGGTSEAVSAPEGAGLLGDSSLCEADLCPSDASRETLLGDLPETVSPSPQCAELRGAAFSASPGQIQGTLVLCTSGSSASGGKLVRLGPEALDWRVQVGSRRWRLRNTIAACRAPAHTIDGVTEYLVPFLAHPQNIVAVFLAESGDVVSLCRFFHDVGATHVTLLPSMVTAIEEAGCMEALVQVRTLILTGEPLLYGALSAALRSLPRTKVYNSYGLTECCGDCLVWRARTVQARAPLGRPLPGVSTRIVAGELQVSSPGLATKIGILDVGEWLRTGDSCTIDHGLVQFNCRLDRRVKLGGLWRDLDALSRALGVPVQCADGRVVLLGDESLVQKARMICPGVPTAIVPGRERKLRSQKRDHRGERLDVPPELCSLITNVQELLHMDVGPDTDLVHEVGLTSLEIGLLCARCAPAWTLPTLALLRPLTCRMLLSGDPRKVEVKAWMKEQLVESLINQNPNASDGWAAAVPQGHGVCVKIATAAAATGPSVAETGCPPGLVGAPRGWFGGRQVHAVGVVGLRRCVDAPPTWSNTLSGNLFAAGDQAGHVVCFDDESRIRWSVDLPAAVLSPVLVSKSCVIAVSAGACVCMDLTGRVRWVRELGAHARGALCDEEHIIVGTYAGEVLVLLLSDGVVRARVTLASQHFGIFAAPVAFPRGLSRYVVCGLNGFVYCLSLNTALELQWQVQFGSPVFCASADSDFVCGTAAGDVICLQEPPAVSWRCHLGAGVSALARVAGKVVAASLEQLVVLVKGEMLFRVSLRCTPWVASCGRWAVVCSEGTVTALDVGSHDVHRIVSCCASSVAAHQSCLMVGTRDNRAVIMRIDPEQSQK